jgi:thiamine-phosphate diphosphorylase
VSSGSRLLRSGRTLALVTDLDLVADWDVLAKSVGLAARGGVDLVQVRAKSLSSSELANLTALLVGSVVGHARIVVNGDPEAAVSAGADGVHLPENGISVVEARRVVGSGALVGRSVHSPDAAIAAEAEGADYLFFGTVFPSESHPGGATSGLDGVKEAATSVSIPVIAIGGITSQNCRSVTGAGASGVAVISAIIGAYDSYRAARELKRALAS